MGGSGIKDTSSAHGTIATGSLLRCIHRCEDETGFVWMICIYRELGRPLSTVLSFVERIDESKRYAQLSRISHYSSKL